MDPKAVALRFVEQHHPASLAAVLGGSVAAGRATKTSDLDVALLYENAAVNYTETVRFEGWLVEAFAHSRTSLIGWFDQESAQRCPVIANIWADGLTLRDEGPLSEIRSIAGTSLEAGPSVLTPGELDERRYQLSAALDDLTGSTSPAELYATELDVFQQTTELLLLLRGSWLGKAKWLVRRLEALTPRDEMVGRLLDFAARQGSSAQLNSVARDVLTLAGGYLQEGHTRGIRRR